MNRFVLLIDCSDERGLIYRVTDCLYKKACNIVSNGEFVDPETGRFYMRTEFEGDVNEALLVSDLKASLPEGASVELKQCAKKNIVLMVTKEYHCLGNLLVRHEFGELNARICAVIGNHEVLRDFVEKYDIPFYFLPHQDIERSIHEKNILEIVERYDPDYIVLAKYMRILSKDFVSNYENRIINIHHSFLPAFIGAKPYRQAFERGVKIIGATAHFVNSNLDDGPIITQSVIPVDHTHSEPDMIKAGRNVEKMVLSNALDLVFDDRVFVSGNKTVIFD